MKTTFEKEPHFENENTFVLDNCKTGGFMLMCTESRTSSPWHNFVSDTDHWVDGTGSTPCLNNGGIYPHQNMLLAPINIIEAINAYFDA